MTEPEISDGFLIDMLRERGYEVSRRGEPDLGDKIDAVGQKIDEMREAPSSPEDARQRVAEGMLKTLNASRTPWFGGDDAA
jgi:hypothetical protein